MGKTAIAVLGMMSIIAMLTFIISIGGISGQVTIKQKPGRNLCPWQYGMQLLDPTEPIPTGCFPGRYQDGTPTKEWVCCNTEYWKAKTTPQYAWEKPYEMKYVRQKSDEGRYY